MKKAHQVAAELGISPQRLKEAPDRNRRILEGVAETMRRLRRDHPDLLPQFHRFLELIMKGSLKESEAASRKLRAELTRRKAA